MPIPIAIGSSPSPRNNMGSKLSIPDGVVDSDGFGFHAIDTVVRIATATIKHNVVRLSKIG